MKVDRQNLYLEAKDFFDLDGNAVMKLSREAAIEVCLTAVPRGVLVIRLEGGIWCNGTFEARLDAIWDGADSPVEEKEAYENNLAAANFTRSQHPGYNAFIITAGSFAGAPRTIDRALPAR
jgi:hypothetical protein